MIIKTGQGFVELKSKTISNCLENLMWLFWMTEDDRLLLQHIMSLVIKIYMAYILLIFKYGHWQKINLIKVVLILERPKQVKKKNVIRKMTIKLANLQFISLLLLISSYVGIKNVVKQRKYSSSKVSLRVKEFLKLS